MRRESNCGWRIAQRLPGMCPTYLICTHTNGRNKDAAWRGMVKTNYPASTERGDAMQTSAPVISHSAEPVPPAASGVRASLPSSAGSGAVTGLPVAACIFCLPRLLLPCQQQRTASLSAPV